MNQISRFFRNISPEAKVVMESSCIWYNIYEYLSEGKYTALLFQDEIRNVILKSDEKEIEIIGAV